MVGIGANSIMAGIERAGECMTFRELGRRACAARAIALVRHRKIKDFCRKCLMPGGAA